MAFTFDVCDAEIAQSIARVADEENVGVTFFLTKYHFDRDEGYAYSTITRHGHQLASYVGAELCLEGLCDEVLGKEFKSRMQLIDDRVGGSSRYFRSNGQCEGARMRQQYAQLIPGSILVGWDMQRPEGLQNEWFSQESPGAIANSLETFEADLARGGSLFA